MSRSQTDSIRGFILDCVAESPRSIARQVAEAYGISRQAANRHLDALVDDGILEQTGFTRSREYRLRRESLLNREIRVTPVLSPERLWDDHIAPVLASERNEVRDLCRGAFRDLIRNVIDHAGATWITVSFSTTARQIDVAVSDNGHGVFNRIGERMGTRSARDCAELVVRHANARSVDFPAARLVLLGRNFEAFTVLSSGVELAFDASAGAWSLRDESTPGEGTRVAFRLRRPGYTNDSSARRSSKNDSTSSTLKPSAIPSST
jgi:DNA-binding transcriptional ArsR family regulator